MGLIWRVLIVLVVLGFTREAGAQTGPVTGAPPPQHVICDSGCTGGVGGSTGQTTMANASSVVIASDQSAVPVTGTFWQATQPVSLASVPSHAVTNAGTFAVQVTSAPTTAVTGTFWQATQPVSGTFWQATQPVSGTVTANAGTNLNTSALALESGGNLSAIRTSVETIDNFISGSRGLVTEDNSAAISSALTTLLALVATAAKQPALGTAGVPSVDVLSVQGAANGAPVVALRMSTLPLPICNPVRRTNCQPKGF